MLYLVSVLPQKITFLIMIFYSSFLGYISQEQQFLDQESRDLGSGPCSGTYVTISNSVYIFESQAFHLCNGQSGTGCLLDRNIGMISLGEYAFHTEVSMFHQ